MLPVKWIAQDFARAARALAERAVGSSPKLITSRRYPERQIALTTVGKIVFVSKVLVAGLEFQARRMASGNYKIYQVRNCLKGQKGTLSEWCKASEQSTEPLYAEEVPLSLACALLAQQERAYERVNAASRADRPRHREPLHYSRYLGA